MNNNLHHFSDKFISPSCVVVCCGVTTYLFNVRRTTESLLNGAVIISLSRMIQTKLKKRYTYQMTARKPVKRKTWSAKHKTK